MGEVLAELAISALQAARSTCCARGAAISSDHVQSRVGGGAAKVQRPQKAAARFSSHKA